jgi:hypothetical protein
MSFINYGLQHAAKTAFLAAAAASPPVDIRGYISFSFTLNILNDIATDTVFNIQAAPASDADPCVPGAFEDIPEVVICDYPAVPGPQSTFMIPAGTKAGSRCNAFMPCRPGAFIIVVPLSGDGFAVEVVVGLHGPK